MPTQVTVRWSFPAGCPDWINPLDRNATHAFLTRECMHAGLVAPWPALALDVGQASLSLTAKDAAANEALESITTFVSSVLADAADRAVVIDRTQCNVVAEPCFDQPHHYRVEPALVVAKAGADWSAWKEQNLTQSARRALAIRLARQVNAALARFIGEYGALQGVRPDSLVRVAIVSDGSARVLHTERSRHRCADRRATSPVLAREGMVLEIDRRIEGSFYLGAQTELGYGRLQRVSTASLGVAGTLSDMLQRLGASSLRAEPAEHAATPR